MADILLRGMEMPTNEPMLVKINPDGSVSTTAKNGYKKYEAVPVPAHGRLIDADALKEKHHWTDDYYETEYVEVEDIDAAPTIIPADPPKEE